MSATVPSSTSTLPATGEVAQRNEEITEGKIYPGEGTVLVVDDLLQVRTVASALLSTLGYEVLLAESGEEALIVYKRRALEGKPVNAVLMDMTLPGGMCGQETTKELLRHDPFAKSHRHERLLRRFRQRAVHRTRIQQRRLETVRSTEALADPPPRHQGLTGTARQMATIGEN